MKIIKYKPDDSPMPELVTFIKEKYGSEKNFDFFFSDFQKAYSFCINNPNISFIPIAAFEDKKIIAHIALINDKRLPKGKAFFGFFEIGRNFSTFKTIWFRLIEEAKKIGISLLLGPVNGNIWHQYRCVVQTNNSEYFKSEPLSKIYYYKFLDQMKPITEISYYSASREKFDKVMRRIQAGFGELEIRGFEIKQFEDISYKQLLSIAKISRIVFNKSWGYTNLTQEEFLELYSKDKLKTHLSKLYLLYKNQQIIGYCGTIKENKHTLVIKTICIVPEYQGLGLGNALAYKIHLDAMKMGFKKVIYALIREGNKIKNFPKDDTLIFRRYSAFEFKI